MLLTWRACRYYIGVLACWHRPAFQQQWSAEFICWHSSVDRTAARAVVGSAGGSCMRGACVSCREWVVSTKVHLAQWRCFAFSSSARRSSRIQLFGRGGFAHACCWVLAMLWLPQLSGSAACRVGTAAAGIAAVQHVSYKPGSSPAATVSLGPWL